MPDPTTSASPGDSLGHRIAQARAKHGLPPEPTKPPAGRGRPYRTSRLDLPFWKTPKKLIAPVALTLLGYLLVCGIGVNIVWISRLF